MNICRTRLAHVAVVLMVVFLAGLTFNSASFTTYAQSQPTIFSVSPSVVYDPSLVPGSSFSVDIEVSYAFDINSWQVEIYWDAGELNALSVAFGSFLSEGGTVPTIQLEDHDNLIGNWLIGELRTDPTSGVYGDGLLCTVTFSVMAVGETVIDISSELTFYLNHYAELVVPFKQNGYFNNIELNVVPELPLGTLMSLVSMLTTVVGFIGFKRYRPGFKRH